MIHAVEVIGRTQADLTALTNISKLLTGKSVVGLIDSSKRRLSSGESLSVCCAAIHQTDCSQHNTLTMMVAIPHDELYSVLSHINGAIITVSYNAEHDFAVLTVTAHVNHFKLMINRGLAGDSFEVFQTIKTRLKQENIPWTTQS
jgi:hypothetical protein